MEYISLEKLLSRFYLFIFLQQISIIQSGWKKNSWQWFNNYKEIFFFFALICVLILIFTLKFLHKSIENRKLCGNISCTFSKQLLRYRTAVLKSCSVDNSFNTRIKAFQEHRGWIWQMLLQRFCVVTLGFTIYLPTYNITLTFNNHLRAGSVAIAITMFVHLFIWSLCCSVKNLYKNIKKYLTFPRYTRFHVQICMLKSVYRQWNFQDLMSLKSPIL